MTLILLLTGLGLIVFGAGWLVDGAVAISRRAGISEFIIGLTVVGFGTSCPELVVSLKGAIDGNADISIGNVVGSNIFNTLFILGVTSLIFPVSITGKMRRMDIPVSVGVSFLLVICGMSNSIFGLGQSDMLSRAEGFIFLGFFAVYLLYCFLSGSEVQAGAPAPKSIGMPKAVLMVVFGLAGLLFGGELFVQKAVQLARLIDVSDKFISLTLLAGGTSVPELAAGIVAAARHEDQLALGNILGSNVFNILLILGCSSVVTPLKFSAIAPVDAAVLIGSSLMVLLWAYVGKKSRIDRWNGLVMILVFVAYYYLLFTKL